MTVNGPPDNHAATWLRGCHDRSGGGGYLLTRVTDMTMIVIDA